MRVSIKSILHLMILSLGLIQTSSCTNNGSPIQSISHGKCFGMCSGYCYVEDTYYSQKIIRHSKANRIKLPEKFDTLSFSEKKWNHLLSTFDLAKFKKLPETIGCPDCADGGAEWIAIKTNDNVYKVSFEYNSNVDGLNELLKLMRKN